MRTYDNFMDRFDLIARMSAAYVLLAMLFLLNVISVPYPMSVFFKGPLILMAIYYWAIYRPTLIPPWLVFLGGILADILTGIPYLGLSAVLFLICRMAVMEQRRFLMGQGFVMVWIGFAIVNVLFHLVQFLVFSLLNLQFVPVEKAAPVLLMGMLLFPVIHVLLYASHKILPEPEGLN